MKSTLSGNDWFYRIEGIQTGMTQVSSSISVSNPLHDVVWKERYPTEGTESFYLNGQVRDVKFSVEKFELFFHRTEKLIHEKIRAIPLKFLKPLVLKIRFFQSESAVRRTPPTQW